MAVTKLTPSVHRIRFGHVQLWLDDLEKILLIIDEQCPNGRTILANGEYRVDRLEDLRDVAEQRLNSLQVDWHDTTVKLMLSSSDASLTMNNPETGYIGMGQLVLSVTRLRSRYFVSTNGPIVAAGLLAGAGASLLTPALFVQYPITTAGFVRMVLSIAGFVGAATGLWIIMPRMRRSGSGDSSAIIYTRTRTDAPTFWERNRDQFIVNALFLIAGGVIGFLTSLFFAR